MENYVFPKPIRKGKYMIIIIFGACRISKYFGPYELEVPVGEHIECKKFLRELLVCVSPVWPAKGLEV